MLLSQLVWDASARRDSTGTVAYCDEAISHAGEIGDQAAAAKAELRQAYVCLYGGSGSRNPATGLVPTCCRTGTSGKSGIFRCRAAARRGGVCDAW